MKIPNGKYNHNHLLGTNYVIEKVQENCGCKLRYFDQHFFSTFFSTKKRRYSSTPTLSRPTEVNKPHNREGTVVLQLCRGLLLNK